MVNNDFCLHFTNAQLYIYTRLNVYKNRLEYTNEYEELQSGQGLKPFLAQIREKCHSQASALFFHAVVEANTLVNCDLRAPFQINTYIFIFYILYCFVQVTIYYLDAYLPN